MSLGLSTSQNPVRSIQKGLPLAKAEGLNACYNGSDITPIGSGSHQPNSIFGTPQDGSCLKYIAAQPQCTFALHSRILPAIHMQEDGASTFLGDPQKLVICLSVPLKAHDLAGEVSFIDLRISRSSILIGCPMALKFGFVSEMIRLVVFMPRPGRGSRQ